MGEMESEGWPVSHPRGRKTFAVVDLGAIRHNVRQLLPELQPGTQIMAVVKADAYGHGSVPAALASLEAGASSLAVAMAEEARPLRAAGIDSPILVIGPSNAEQLALCAELDLDTCVFTPEQLQELDRAAASAGKTAKAHLKLDTGMGRIGIRDDAELEQFLDALPACRSVELTGLFTHFATADSYGSQEHAREQHRRFSRMAAAVRQRGCSPRLHVSNSAASQDLPECDHDMVRFGISLYGYPAGPGNAARPLALRPAMTVFAEISHIKDLQPGDTVGYGAAFRAERPMRVATVQIGYGDGYSRLLSNRGRMLVRTSDGVRYAPVVGRVCMDMTMIDVTDLPGVQRGDLAMVLGRSGPLHVDADDIADLTGTISYEVLLDFSSRVPRLYTGEQKGGGGCLVEAACEAENG